jgi:hypothetical protein
MKIGQISVLSGRAQQFLAKMLGIANLLQYVEFKLDTSLYNNIKDDGTFTGTAARAIGSAVQKDAQAPVLESAALAAYGREISIDDVYKLDKNVGMAPAGLRILSDRRLGALCVKLAEEIQDDIINGTAAANQMLGLLTFVADAAAGGQTTRLGFTTAELAAMNYQVNLKISNDLVDNQDTFVETLMKKIAEVPGANGIICNTSFSARLSTIAKRKGAAGETVNSFGQKVKTFDNRPIIEVPDAALPNTQSDGQNNDCTSMFIVRFAEELGLACSTNSGFYFQDFQDYETYPQGVARLQMFLNLSCERTDAVRRLSRIRL